MANSAFIVGQHYSRKEISEICRGSIRACLPTFGNVVVAVCPRIDINPLAPEEILVRKGVLREKNAKALRDQQTTVPVFIKEATYGWKYVGEYRAESYTDDPHHVAATISGYGLTPKAAANIKGILRLAATGNA